MSMGINLLTASFDNSGRLATEAGHINTQLLVMGIVLAIIWALITGAFIFYLIQFNKNESKAKIWGKPSIYGTFGLSILLAIFWILEMVFFHNAKSIFGVDGANTAYAVVLTMAILGFVSLAIMIILLWVFLPTFGIAFDDEKILFLGEYIKYNRVVKIIDDDSKHAVYIHYTVGRKTNKRQKFSKKSIFGQFILQNASLTGQKVVKGNENEFYKSLISIPNVQPTENKTSIEENKQNKIEEKKDVSQIEKHQPTNKKTEKTTEKNKD